MKLNEPGRMVLKWQGLFSFTCLHRQCSFCLVPFVGQPRGSGRVHQRLHDNHAIAHGASSQHCRRPAEEAPGHGVTWPHHTGVGRRDSAAAVRLQRPQGVSHHHRLPSQPAGLCLRLWERGCAGLQCAVHLPSGWTQVSSVLLMCLWVGIYDVSTSCVYCLFDWTGVSSALCVVHMASGWAHVSVVM